ncbi:MAG TPA: NAD(+)/NADH kinase [Bacillota bacterium]|nr:NAD(+)/NADH kinase [Bacillota bacterium]
MKKRIINIFSNDLPASENICSLLKEKLERSGFVVPGVFSHDAELLVCVGGDGATLEAINKYDFPKVPIVGINTGHLGFFQEINPNQLDEFITNYKAGKYRLQPLSTVQATVLSEDGPRIHRGLNEIVIKGWKSYSAHLNISIGGSFIERFSGDGIIISTPAGSTAYNYSLGGSIIDPRLKALQVAPIAPMNTTAYRSFTSSILLPSDLSLDVVPEYIKSNQIYLINDGIETEYRNVTSIKVEFSDTVVNLLRFETYDFWNKVKTKFL